MNNIKNEISTLLHKVRPLDPSKGINVKPVDPTSITEFTTSFGIKIPDDLREWLLLCNGSHTNPGGLYGIKTGDETLEIGRFYNLFPGWKEKFWIPLASDGCGDYYVLDVHFSDLSNYPVYFIDQSEYETPAYIVGSNIWKFLKFLFTSEIQIAKGEEPFWPFNKRKVLSEDPALTSLNTAPLPWNS